MAMGNRIWFYPLSTTVSANEILIFKGNGDGTFQAPSVLSASQPNVNVITGDFNGDGKTDLVLANCCGDTSMTYFLGNGDGTFRSEASFNGGPNPEFVASADFNNDGKPDLAIANETIKRRIGDPAEHKPSPSLENDRGYQHHPSIGRDRKCVRPRFGRDGNG